MDTIKRAWGNIRDGAAGLFTSSFVVRKRHGGTVMAMPLIFAILILVLALKFALILIIIALVAGFRFSVDKR